MVGQLDVSSLSDGGPITLWSASGMGEGPTLCSSDSVLGSATLCSVGSTVGFVTLCSAAWLTRKSGTSGQSLRVVERMRARSRICATGDGELEDGV
jgi:hypothetical protein